jgi:hypothetical protein
MVSWKWCAPEGVVSPLIGIDHSAFIVILA